MSVRSPVSLGRSLSTLRLVGLALALPLGGCSGGTVRSVEQARPLQERRALAVIADAIRDAGLEPVAGRQVSLGDDVSVKLDVGVHGKRYGVAYLTGADRQALGASFPLLKAGSTELQVSRGAGEDEQARVLLLQDTNYLFDDMNDDENEQRTLTAELRLTRDVTDFLVRARSERWP